MINEKNSNNKIDDVFFPALQGFSQSNKQESTEHLSVQELFNRRKNENVEVNTKKSFKQMELEVEQERLQEMKKQEEKNKQKIQRSKHIFNSTD